MYINWINQVQYKNVKLETIESFFIAKLSYTQCRCNKHNKYFKYTKKFFRNITQKTRLNIQIQSKSNIWESRIVLCCRSFENDLRWKNIHKTMTRILMIFLQVFDPFSTKILTMNGLRFLHTKCLEGKTIWVNLNKVVVCLATDWSPSILFTVE